MGERIGRPAELDTEIPFFGHQKEQLHELLRKSLAADYARENGSDTITEEHLQHAEAQIKGMDDDHYQDDLRYFFTLENHRDLREQLEYALQTMPENSLTVEQLDDSLFRIYTQYKAENGTPEKRSENDQLIGNIGASYAEQFNLKGLEPQLSELLKRRIAFELQKSAKDVRQKTKFVASEYTEEPEVV